MIFLITTRATRDSRGERKDISELNLALASRDDEQTPGEIVSIVQKGRKRLALCIGSFRMFSDLKDMVRKRQNYMLDARRVNHETAEVLFGLARKQQNSTRGDQGAMRAYLKQADKRRD